MSKDNKKETWIIKIGSSLLTEAVKDQKKGGSVLNEPLLKDLAKQFVALRQANKNLILVSSGSVAVGRHKLGSKISLSQQLKDIQVAASIGQTGLMGAYERILGDQGIIPAQILLTHYDFQRRNSYLNTRACLTRLLDIGCLPIVNENDTLMDEEVCFGDNDMLAAMTANLISASMLIILTDISGLHDKNPRLDKSAKIIKEIDAEDPQLDSIETGESGGLGKGGMLSKIKAARLAAQSGATTIITSGKTPEVLLEIMRGENPGTKLTSKRGTSLARKRWLAGQLRPLGKLHLDAGAARALREKGVSLLSIGVVSVAGNFERGDPVSCCDENGKEIARGLVNYSSKDCDKIKRLPSSKIGSVLGYEYETELIHRDNLAIL